jgi:legumain
MAVLKGDAATAGGKVLKSDANSKVFFYFADHGAPGLVAMPVGGYLYANDFHKTLKFMNENKMYKEMTVYIEACESGSMFENILEDNLNIYAVTAANASESSWGAYCYPDDKINGQSVGSCLGDLFSINWMEDTEAANINTETLEEQFKTVRTKTNRSHVLQFGQQTFTPEPIANFQGVLDSNQAKDSKNLWHKIKDFGKKEFKELNKITDVQKTNDFAVDQRDTQLHYLYNKVMTESTVENQMALQKELANRVRIESAIKAAFPAHIDALKNKTTPNPVTDADFECYKSLIEEFEAKCGKSEFNLKFYGALVAECKVIQAYPAILDDTSKRIAAACVQPIA